MSSDGELTKIQWWQERKNELIQMTQKKSPLYVYNIPTVVAAARSLKTITNIDRFFYAIKANPNTSLMKILEAEGLGFECVSPGELNHILQLFPQIDRKRVLFTPNFAAREEYELGFKENVHVNVDSLYALTHWPEVFANREILVRMDPGKGEGHHKYVKTAGKLSKFGISSSDVEKLSDVTKKHNVTVIGLHAHLGSGILTPDSWKATAMFLNSVRKHFPAVRILDLGGGLGVAYKEDQVSLDVESVNQLLSDFKQTNPSIELWLEPGRYLVAVSGVMLSRVTQVKEKDDMVYVGVNAGFNCLIRPMLYNSYHQIVNLTKVEMPKTLIAEVVGNICESGDVFGHERALSPTQEGDVILMATAGAYGHSMSSNYNLRDPPEEILLQ